MLDGNTVALRQYEDNAEATDAFYEDHYEQAARDLLEKFAISYALEAVELGIMSSDCAANASTSALTIYFANNFKSSRLSGIPAKSTCFHDIPHALDAIEAHAESDQFQNDVDFYISNIEQQ